MKKLTEILVLYVLFFCFFLFLEGFKNDSKDLIYKVDSEWEFLIKRTNSQSIDTINLQVIKPKHEGNKGFRWILNTSELTSSRKMSDTSIEELSRDIVKVNTLLIPSPTNQYFKYTEAIPSPQVYFPKLYRGYSSKSTKVIHKINPDELDSITVSGKIEVTNKIYYDNPIIKDNCWVLNAVGESSMGTFKAKYYFHEKYGFVYFYYDFITYQIEMELISMKNIE